MPAIWCRARSRGSGWWSASCTATSPGDQGAAEVARAVCRERLDAAAVLAGYSRLVIDCNRSPEHETSIAEVSDGTAVPGNVGISEAARAARKRVLFDPYHDGARRGAGGGARARPDAGADRGPQLHPGARRRRRGPWQVSVLWGYDPRVPVPLLAALRRSRRSGGRRQPALFGAQPAWPHHQGAWFADRDAARADRDPRRPGGGFERRGALCRHPRRRAGDRCSPSSRRAERRPEDADRRAVLHLRHRGGIPPRRPRQPGSGRRAPSRR